MIAEFIIYHHSGTDDGPVNNWEVIRNYHKSYRIDGQEVNKQEYERRLAAGDGKYFLTPWRDIAYHAGVEAEWKPGEKAVYVIRDGRSPLTPGAHAPGYNGNSLGFCFVGNFTKYPPREEMLHAGAIKMAAWALEFKIPLENILPHNRVNDTDCPGELFPHDKLIGYIGELLEGREKMAIVETALEALYQALLLLQPKDKIEKFDEEWRVDREKISAALLSGDSAFLNSIIAKYSSL
jgi:hypothetical protein